MKLVLERHVCAPELNKAYIIKPDGELSKEAFSVPGAASIKQARTFFSSSKRKGLFAEVHVIYPEPINKCNRSYRGYIENLLDLQEQLAKMRAYHNATYLGKGAEFKIKLRLRG